MEALQKHSQEGIKGLLINYSKKKFFKSLKFVSICAIFTFIIIILSDKPRILFIETLIDLILVIVPSVFGFVLAGFTIVISFGNSKFLKSISMKALDNPPSLYQTISSIFTIIMLIQILTLLLAVIVKLILTANLNFIVNNGVAIFINYTTVFTLLLLLYYSLFTLLDLGKNLFNLSQTYHTFLLASDGDDED